MLESRHDLPQPETKHGFTVELRAFLADLDSAARSRDLTVLSLDAWHGSVANLELIRCEDMFDLAARLGDGVLYRIPMIPGGELHAALQVTERFRLTADGSLPGDGPESEEMKRMMMAGLDRLQTLLHAEGMAGLRLGFLRGGALHQIRVTDEEADLFASLLADVFDDHIEAAEDNDDGERPDLTELEPEDAAAEIIRALDRAGVPSTERSRHPKDHAETALHMLVDDLESLPRDKKRNLYEAVRIATRRLRTG